MNTCGKLFQVLLKQWKKMDLEDLAAWKLCLVLCGMLLAIYHEALCKKARFLIWVGFLATLMHTLCWFIKSMNRLVR